MSVKTKLEERELQRLDTFLMESKDALEKYTADMSREGKEVSELVKETFAWSLSLVERLGLTDQFAEYRKRKGAGEQ